MTLIDVNSKQIGDAEAKELAEALKVNQTITRIDLGGNQIGDAGAKELAEALKVNQTITRIGLSGNRIGAALVTQIYQYISDVNKQNRAADGRRLAQARRGVEALGESVASARESNTRIPEFRDEMETDADSLFESMN